MNSKNKLIFYPGKKYFFAGLFFLFSFLFKSQDISTSQKNYDLFKEYCQETDTVSMKKLLKKWEKDSPGDAELYTSYFNYYILRARVDAIVLQKEQKGENSLQINDSASGNQAGFLNDGTFYKEKELKLGMDYIDKGIKLHPNRLDMYFGKIHMLGEVENYTAQKEEIFRVIELSQKNKNQWLWTENLPKPDAKNFMLACIQDYIVKMYDNNKTDLVKIIGEKIISVYPDNVESLSNIAVAYFIEKNFDKALEYLFKAEKLAPKDVVVLNNIAWAYAQKKENKKAIEYYEKVIKYGDEDAKEYANKQIVELKNK